MHHLIFSIITVLVVFSGKLQADQVYKFLQPAMYYPYSYDPLDGDILNVMLPLRMRFLTPIEIDHKDTFKSTALSSFIYDEISNEMTWIPQKNIKYSDGTEMSATDITIALKRMLLARPDFPIIEHIAGKKKWLEEKYPLLSYPSGIWIAKDNSIHIKFDEKIENPYFRFSTELFSILPEKCFDLKISKLICETPPSGGYYEFERNPNIKPKSEDIKNTTPLTFILRNGFDIVHGRAMPKKIVFNYTPEGLDSTIEKVDDTTVISSMDTRLSDDFLNKNRERVVIKRLPKTSVWYILLNPSSPLFSKKECRRIFANQYRKIYGEKVKSIGVATKSFFSLLMPGYLANQEIESSIPEPEIKLCSEFFAKNSPKIRKIVPNNPDFFWDKMLESTMKALEIKTDGIYSEKEEIIDFIGAYVNKETPVVAMSMGFWAQDLVGDFQMFFDEKMHPEFKDLLKDGKLKALARNLQTEKDPNRISQIYKEINLYLYDQAVLNPLSHFGIVYVSKKSSFNKIPIATSQPSPWQLFYSMME